MPAALMLQGLGCVLSDPRGVMLPEDMARWEANCAKNERHRRRNNSEGSMLQRVVDLKKKKNMEHTRGSSFASLQNDELNKVAMDVNIKIGKDLVESGRIIDNLVEFEKLCMISLWERTLTFSFLQA
jgi:hypothetical protein